MPLINLYYISKSGQSIIMKEKAKKQNPISQELSPRAE